MIKSIYPFTSSQLLQRHLHLILIHLSLLICHMPSHVISIVKRVSNQVRMTEHVFLSQIFFLSKMQLKFLSTHILTTHYLNNIFLFVKQITIPVEKTSKDLRWLVIAL